MGGVGLWFRSGGCRVPTILVRLLVAAVQPVKVGIVIVVAHGMQGYPSEGFASSAACLPVRHSPAVHPMYKVPRTGGCAKGANVRGRPVVSFLLEVRPGAILVIRFAGSSR